MEINSTGRTSDIRPDGNFSEDILMSIYHTIENSSIVMQDENVISGDVFFFPVLASQKNQYSAEDYYNLPNVKKMMSLYEDVIWDIRWKKFPNDTIMNPTDFFKIWDDMLMNQTSDVFLYNQKISKSNIVPKPEIFFMVGYRECLSDNQDIKLEEKITLEKFEGIFKEFLNDLPIIKNDDDLNVHISGTEYPMPLFPPSRFSQVYLGLKQQEIECLKKHQDILTTQKEIVDFVRVAQKENRNIPLKAYWDVDVVQQKLLVFIKKESGEFVDDFQTEIGMVRNPLYYLRTISDLIPVFRMRIPERDPIPYREDFESIVPAKPPELQLIIGGLK